MRVTADDIRRAERALRRDPLVGPRLAPLVTRYGPCPLHRRRSRSHFEALAGAIVFQQLAGKAATAIWGRVRAALEGRVTPDTVLAVPVDQLRAAGLSGAKTRSLLDLAAHVVDGSLPLHRLARMPDDEVTERLVVVRGVGRWTAEMFLMFQLARPDVWPAGDLGVRKGYALLAGLSEPPDPGRMFELGARFSPHRSVAAWYCWRAAETLTP